MNGQTFAGELEKLGYFSYTSQEHLEEAKSSLKNSFDTSAGIIASTQMEGRVFSCGDCEELFETGGVPELLEQMSALFTALNICMEYKDDNYTEDGHTISVNGRTYVMAEGSILAWGETFLRFAEMINQELELQAVQERVYLLSYDDCQYMVFLTEGQLSFIRQYVLRENSPLITAEWEVTTIDSIMKSLNGE